MVNALDTLLCDKNHKRGENVGTWAGAFASHIAREKEKKRTGNHCRITGPPHQETPHYRVNLMVTIKELCYNLTGLGGGRSSRGQAAALKAALGIENL
jgi:hypothetical protein